MSSCKVSQTKPLSIHWTVIEWSVLFKLVFLGCPLNVQSFLFFFKIQCFLFLYFTQLVEKLQQWSLYEVIEDTLPIVLNTKQPLSDIWLLRYKQNDFGCFWRKSDLQFFQKTPKTILLISLQLNVAQRPFCIQNKWQDILYHLIL